MEKMVSSVMVVFLVVCAVGVSWAHPPSSIEITYDPQEKVVTAVITHPVQNPATHYINKVDIGLNGQEVIAHSLGRQDNDMTQTVSYKIPDAMPGDTLSVEGYCNINGKREVKVFVQ
ncbi:MAG: hypothetical protein KKC84_04210 [Candidatus Omnitrophica bacterium]|nr:hypothetical protein [Candidatus Omnitrophota bacterium]